MKVGDITDIVAQLRHDVCFNGRKAYVVTCGCEFDAVVRQLASDVACGNFALAWIDCKMVPKELICIYEIAIARKSKELREVIFEATAENWHVHRDELYVVIGEEKVEQDDRVCFTMRDIQLAIDTFAEMAGELGGDLPAAVDRFNDCYNGKSFFDESMDAPPFCNAERLEMALKSPICLIGRRFDKRDHEYEEMCHPHVAFLSLVLAYVSKMTDYESRETFFRCAMKECDPRFTATKAVLYWYFHEYRVLGGEIREFPGLGSCRLSKKVFGKLCLRLSQERGMR